MASFSFTVNNVSIPLSESVAVTVSGKSYKLSLLSLGYEKKIYQPGRITAKVQLKENSDSNAKTAPDQSSVISYFGGKSVALSSNSCEIATNYYVYKVEPEYNRASDGQYCKVTLHICSLDHKLTLDRYCKTYVNQKLCADILKTESEEETVKIDGKDTNVQGILKKAGVGVDYANLCFLQYLSEDGSRREFIQPYLVQYNESFYDFLARTANRCGEYLFFEQGQLHVGLDVSVSATPIEKNVVTAYRYEGADDSLVTMADSYTDGTDLTADDSLYAAEGDTYFCYDELPVDDYLGMFFKKNGFADYGTELFKDYWFILVDTLNSILNMQSVMQMLGKTAEKYAEAIVKAGSSYALKNEKGNKKWIEKAPSEQYDATTETRTVYGSMLSDSAKLLNHEEQQNLNAKFYQFVSKCCRSAGRQQIAVDAGVGNTACKLGDMVTFDDKQCVVTEVSEVLKYEQTDAATPTPPLRGQQLVLVPQLTAQVHQYSGATPTGNTTAESITVTCPPMVRPSIRTSGTQRAFIAASGDPEGLGRVCIRYPWQRADDNPSPWIRMAVPFAPNDAPNGSAGFNFCPSVGDEVLVDYENGNMEHPYVVGALYSRRTKAPKGNRSICSSKGHSLTFNDGDSVQDFLAGIYPGIGQLSSYLSLAGVDISFGNNDNFTGGVALTDKWGLYKIAASATERRVDIKSPFGNVSINAFSGITISAPNGDITIKGKNVTIEAGNEVSITSGKFIDEKKKEALDYLKEFFKSAISSATANLLAPFTDLSIARTVWEALLKPVAGTMTIQSGRYLLLNAGGGKAEIPNKGFSVGGLKKIEKENADKIKLANTLRLIFTLSSTWMNSLATLYQHVQQAVASFNDSTYKNDLKTPDPTKIVKEISARSIQSEYKKDDMKFDKNYAHVKQASANLCALINMVREKMLEANQYCADIKSGKDVGELKDKYFVKELKAVLSETPAALFPKVVNDIYVKSEKFDQDPNVYVKSDDNKKLLRRMLSEKLIGKLKVLDQYPDPTKGETKVVFVTANDYLDADKWSRYVGCLGEYKESFGEGLLSKFKTQMTENIPGVGWKDERNIWDTCKQGEILLSDKGGRETINIVNGVLTRTTNNDGFEEQLTDILNNF